MPKSRTLKAAAKRFKVSPSGTVKHKQSCLRHLLTKKSTKRKQNLRPLQCVDQADLGRLERCLPGAF